MPQIINELGIGQNLGQGLNTGIQQALSYLTQQKLNHLTEIKNSIGNISALEGSGFPTDQARKIAASNNPHIIAAAIKAGPRGNPEAEKRAAEEAYGIHPSYTAENINAIGEGAQRNPSSMDNIQQIGKPNPVLNQQAQDYLKRFDPFYREPQNIFGKVTENAAPKELVKETDQAIKKAKQENPAERASDYFNIPTALPTIDPTKLTPALYKEALKERHAIEQEAAKEGEEFWKERLNSKQEIPHEEHAIKEMLKLRKKGTLPTAKEWKWLTDLEENPAKITAAGTAAGAALGASTLALGGPVSAGIGAGIGGAAGTVVGYLGHLYATIRKSELREGNPDIAQYEKLAASLVKGLPKMFKGTISEAVLTSYMDIIPTLSVDNEGAIRILEDIHSGIELTKKLNETADKMYAQNGYKIPRGFQALVLKAHESEVEKWINGLQDTVDYAEKLPKTATE